MMLAITVRTPRQKRALTPSLCVLLICKAQMTVRGIASKIMSVAILKLQLASCSFRPSITCVGLMLVSQYAATGRFATATATTQERMYPA